MRGYQLYNAEESDDPVDLLDVASMNLPVTDSDLIEKQAVLGGFV